MSSFILATGGYDTQIRFFDVTNQALVRTLQFCDQQVLRIAFSGRGPVAATEPLFLVAAGSPSVVVYDVSTHGNVPNIFATYQGHTAAVTAVGFEPYHTAFVFSASEDGTLQTWVPVLAVGEALGIQPQNRVFPADRRFQSVPAKFVNGGPRGNVGIHDAAYHPPKDLFFTVDAIGRLRVWEHASKSLRSEHVPHTSRRNIQSVELSFDHTTLVLANFDGFVFVYDVGRLLAGRDVPRTFRADSSYIPRVKLNIPGNVLVCTTRWGAIKVFRMADVMGLEGASGAVAPSRNFVGHTGCVWDVALLEEGERLFCFTCSGGVQGKKVIFWDLQEQEQSLEVCGHDRAVVCLALKARSTVTTIARRTERGSGSETLPAR